MFDWAGAICLQLLLCTSGFDGIQLLLLLSLVAALPGHPTVHMPSMRMRGAAHVTTAALAPAAAANYRTGQPRMAPTCPPLPLSLCRRAMGGAGGLD